MASGLAEDLVEIATLADDADLTHRALELWKPRTDLIRSANELCWGLGAVGGTDAVADHARAVEEVLPAFDAFSATWNSHRRQYAGDTPSDG